MPGILAPLLLLATAAPAGIQGVGDLVERFSLEDQHGNPHQVDSRVRAILLSRDMAGGDLIKNALAERDPAMLERIPAVTVADISGMPGLIARMFAIPRMRERPYPMLLDRDGAATAGLPDQPGRATLIVLEDLRIVSVEHFDSEVDLGDALAKLEGSR